MYREVFLNFKKMTEKLSGPNFRAGIAVKMKGFLSFRPDLFLKPV